LLLGDSCTRRCAFCAVNKSAPKDIDPREPERIANTAQKLKLRYLILTSVTRDDLPDGGAAHFVRCIESARRLLPRIKIEILTPDFNSNIDSATAVALARPDIFAHNIEVVPRLYKSVRPGADYSRSIGLLRLVKRTDKTIITKSGIMVGMGEEEKEIMSVMSDLREAGCNFLTIGQYLSPTRYHYPVFEYVRPEMFEKFKDYGYRIGFDRVESAPLARTSYNAVEALSAK